MLRQEEHPVETAPSFERVLGRRTWHEWPGVAGVATGVALWVFLAIGVVAPLGDALAHLQPAAGAPPAACPTPVEGAVAAGTPPCACDCPEPRPPHARRG